MKRIMLNAEDLPTAKNLVDAISRLSKDYRLLSKFQGTKDIEDPESFRRVVGFLEMLVKREKRNLPKTESTEGKYMEIMIEAVAAHLAEMDPWEAKCTIQETGLKKVFDKVAHEMKETEDG